MKKFILIVLALLLITTIYFLYSLFYSPNKNESVVVKIDRGYSISKIIDELNKQDYLKPKEFYLIISRVVIPKNKTINQGTIIVPPNTSNFKLFFGLYTGEFVFKKKITMPEGMNIKQYASIFKKELDIDSAKFVHLANSSQIIQKYNIPATTLEGYLFPNTYFIDYGKSEEEIIDFLVNQFEKVWQKSFAGKALPLEMSRHQIITLASVVEAETPVSEERPKVAGVYINRLKKGMPLQADPTVQYALNKFSRLTYSDLNYENPYNTYKNIGLPPSPINSPSKSSIDAVVNYEKHNFIFFVAKGDGSGTHNFARNYDEHLKNVSLYRKNIGRKNG
ncbi:MAG: endolytic transglycosylase MltG [Bacteroidota bacterium]